MLTVVGARPQFIKAAPVSRVLRRDHEEYLVHTGQHYDEEMSAVFFSELGIPEPDIDLGVGSGSHGKQTGEMLASIERVLEEQSPDVVMVYGDTNSTLAGALAAAKLCIPVAHVEAGLRSFDRTMPEEVNRVVTDHVSEALFAPTETAVENLHREGLVAGVELVGDVMLDAARLYAEMPDASEVLARFGIEPGRYCLATVHRAGNTDDPERLASILEAFARLSLPVVFPCHPRTLKSIERSGLRDRLTGTSVMLTDPVSYGTLMALLGSAACVLTDSGGMQKEAYFFGVPCVTLRENTEWIETVEAGWNTLVGADPEAIVAAVECRDRPAERPAFYGDGHAAERVVGALEQRFGAQAT